MRLTVKRVARLLSAGIPGRHFDEAGLYLVIESKTNAHWERRYQLHDKTHYLGLGSARHNTFTLEEAREENRQISQQLTKKIDPLKARRAERAQRAAEEAHSITFGDAAEEYFKTNAPTWRHRAHVGQWSATVLGRTPQGSPARQDYCHALRRLPVQDIDTPIIMGVLRPIWHERPETASRIRARIAAVLDWAKAAGYRTGDNAAAWDIIGKLLPSRSKVARVKHFEAVPYAEMPAFMSDLRERHGSAARALEFAILAAARTQEVLGATWPEIELEEGLWIILAERMKKTDREHRVPLSPQAVQLLRSLPREPDSSVVFVGTQEGKGLSDAALVGVMRRMGAERDAARIPKLLFGLGARADGAQQPRDRIEPEPRRRHGRRALLPARQHVREKAQADAAVGRLLREFAAEGEQQGRVDSRITQGKSCRSSSAEIYWGELKRRQVPRIPMRQRQRST